MPSDAPSMMDVISLQRFSKAASGLLYSRFTAFRRSSISFFRPLR